jgi:hypothetical protein
MPLRGRLMPLGVCQCRDKLAALLVWSFDFVLQVNLLRSDDPLLKEAEIFREDARIGESERLTVSRKSFSLSCLSISISLRCNRATGFPILGIPWGNQLPVNVWQGCLETLGQSVLATLTVVIHGCLCEAERIAPRQFLEKRRECLEKV